METERSQFDTAMLFARIQLRRERMEDMNVPASILERERDLNRKVEEQLTDEGRQFLPFAFAYEETIAKRRVIINYSLLGRLQQALFDVGYSKFPFMPFKDPIEPELDEYWQDLRENIESGDVEKAFKALWEIVSNAQAELLFLELPAIPTQEEFQKES